MNHLALAMYNLNGFEKAKEKLIEEISELLVELTKYDGSVKNQESIAMEMFDVVFCIEQMRCAFDKSMLESIERYKKEKIERLYL